MNADSIDEKDYMNNFATEEFVTKNIRVMPVNHGQAGDQQSEYTQSKHLMHSSVGESETEDTSKMNLEAYHDILDQRAVVKDKKAEAVRKAQEAAEREAKKNAKKR